MNLFNQIPKSTIFEIADLKGKTLLMDYTEERQGLEAVKVLTGKDIKTGLLYVLFYELGNIKEDA